MQDSTLTLTFKYYNSYDLFMRILKISIFICIPLLFFLLKLLKLLPLLGTFTAFQRYARIILLFMSLVSYFTNPSCRLNELMCFKLPRILNEWFCFMQPRCVAQLDITRPHQRKVLCEAWMIFLQWTQGVKPVNMCRHHYLELTVVPTKTLSQGVVDDILLFHLNRIRLR